VEKPSTSVLSPRSPKSWPADAFAWPRSLLVLVALGVAFYVGLLLDSYIAIRLLGTTRHDITSSTLTWGIAIGQYFSYVPILLVLLVGMPWVSRQSLSALGLRGFDRRTVIAGIIGALAMYAVTIGVANLQFTFTHQKPEETAITLFTSTHDTMLIVAFTFLATIAAPFMEEFVYRGFLFNALARYAPVWLAAVVSGVLFGLSHGSSSAFLPLAASGVVLAYVYQRSGSLTASMLTHALFNLINVALISVAKS
jgi:membrane protease YdiL (CAAX protease family)